MIARNFSLEIIASTHERSHSQRLWCLLSKDLFIKNR
jgi:hypothetical protein